MALIGYNWAATTVFGQLHHICTQDCHDLLCVSVWINYGPILYTQNLIIITQSEGMKPYGVALNLVSLVVSLLLSVVELVYQWTPLSPVVTVQCQIYTYTGRTWSTLADLSHFVYFFSQRLQFSSYLTLQLYTHAGWLSEGISMDRGTF